MELILNELAGGHYEKCTSLIKRLKNTQLTPLLKLVQLEQLYSAMDFNPVKYFILRQDLSDLYFQLSSLGDFKVENRPISINSSTGSLNEEIVSLDNIDIALSIIPSICFFRMELLKMLNLFLI